MRKNPRMHFFCTPPPIFTTCHWTLLSQ